ncbi:hypothetical protein F1728_10835 [Gimesia benthica]|uniref:Uncharacterized protein n=1 Tax=Gimesia benthica TaxID=2608982 RepID=A0A6I6AA43_9PLAN|nr:hypothetical protein [Gimesia benthica]QGQ23133.1 hypothetical protein F1728_10835 [Gimesia benthica]
MPMLLTLGKRLAQGYGLLLAMAAGGLVFANLFGLGAFLIQEIGSDNQRAASLEPYRWWMHCGWWVGVGFALTGAVTRKRATQTKTVREQTSAATESADLATPESGRWKTVGKRSGVLSSVAFFGCAGGFAGLMLGGSLLLLWFSLAYSPFAPAGWAGSVKVEQRANGHLIENERVMTTTHPVALYAFGVPIGLGATAGAIIGGVGAALGKVEDVE